MPAQSAGDHVEGGVGKYAAGGQQQQVGAEAGLVLAVEAQSLNPDESQQCGQDGHDEDDAVRRVCQIDCQPGYLLVLVLDQHEEENQADQAANQGDQAEKQALEDVIMISLPLVMQ